MKKYDIQTERLGLRNWSMEDLDSMTALNQDPKVMEFFPALQNREKTADLITRMQDHYADQGFCYFAADILETGEFIGFIGLMTQTYLSEYGEFTDIGWRLKQAAWGKGFATEGAKACLKFAKDVLEKKEIYSVCSVINVKSEKVMLKIGMKKSHTFKHPALVNSPELEECYMYKIEL